MLPVSPEVYASIQPVFLTDLALVFAMAAIPRLTSWKWHLIYLRISFVLVALVSAAFLVAGKGDDQWQKAAIVLSCILLNVAGYELVKRFTQPIGLDVTAYTADLEKAQKERSAFEARLKETQDDIRSLLTVMSSMVKPITQLIWHALKLPPDRFTETAHVTASFVLEQMVSLLKQQNGVEIDAAVFAAESGKMRVIGMAYIPPFKRALMERSFSYDGEQPQGIAGLCAHRMKPVLIPDLSSPDFADDATFWVKLHENDRRAGTILCIPLLSEPSSLDEQNPRLLGVLSFSSRSPRALDLGYSDELLRFFENKITALLLVHEVARRRHNKDDKKGRNRITPQSGKT